MLLLNIIILFTKQNHIMILSYNLLISLDISLTYRPPHTHTRFFIFGWLSAPLQCHFIVQYIFNQTLITGTWLMLLVIANSAIVSISLCYLYHLVSIWNQKWKFLNQVGEQVRQSAYHDHGTMMCVTCKLHCLKRGSILLESWKKIQFLHQQMAPSLPLS